MPSSDPKGLSVQGTQVMAAMAVLGDSNCERSRIGCKADAEDGKFFPKWRIPRQGWHCGCPLAECWSQPHCGPWQSWIHC